MFMKKIIIVAPHFPPSNLAAVHRTRLFAQHLPSFGWEPIIVTVHPDYYEESPDWNLHEMLPAGLRIEKVKALPVKPIRTIGDIGVRGFYFMYKKIIELARKEKIDFLFIPIPSNYAALLGRMVFRKTGIPFGIDYIDPWVHRWPGTERKFSRHWWSMKLGEWLEPVAVKNVALITGVAPGYFEDVLKRNEHLRDVITAAMPYGGEASDHEFVKTKALQPYLFKKEEGIVDMVYAGAMLPRAFEPLKQVLHAMARNKEEFRNVRFHFIGTGTSPNNSGGFNIKPHAEPLGLWENTVFEYPKRIPYLDVLTHLSASDGIFILGSTEPHYTPSKLYQAVLSHKPVFAILHEKSTAGHVINASHAGLDLAFNGQEDVEKIGREFVKCWNCYRDMARKFDPAQIDMQEFQKYSAFNITRSLSAALDEAVALKRKEGVHS